MFVVGLLTRGDAGILLERGICGEALCEILGVCDIFTPVLLPGVHVPSYSDRVDIPDKLGRDPALEEVRLSIVLYLVW
jgi:hypothetical protein